MRGANAEVLIAKLNPIIRGWAAYYRIGVSKRAFRLLDHHVWRLTYKWAKHSHPNKSRNWVVTRYFGQFDRFRQDKWVFGDRHSGLFLRRFAWTPIVRHRMVPGTASPDDPALADFWTTRHRRSKPLLDPVTLRLFRAQDGRCSLCVVLLLHADRGPQTPDQWEQWFKVVRHATRKHAVEADTGTPDGRVAPRLIHTGCRRRRMRGVGGGSALLTVREPSGLA
ncbi:group II intron maturase-specific domain-containing protein [Streptomyces mirabilis]|uniref:group II intron maturase-specific domain-containing protein n=1 Tax=Streptomyces mirabilis TaxID=68239 RepID=UPI003331984E